MLFFVLGYCRSLPLELLENDNEWQSPASSWGLALRLEWTVGNVTIFVPESFLPAIGGSGALQRFLCCRMSLNPKICRACRVRVPWYVMIFHDISWYFMQHMPWSRLHLCTREHFEILHRLPKETPHVSTSKSGVMNKGLFRSPRIQKCICVLI